MTTVFYRVIKNLLHYCIAQNMVPGTVKMKKDYDIAVIGAGPGGYIAALKAAALKARVALIERDSFGGACLNLGCIPTKTLYQSSHNFLTYLEYAHLLKTPVVQDRDLRQRAFEYATHTKDKVIGALRKQLEGMVKHSPIKVYRGAAYLRSGKEITINGQAQIGADTIILATGSSPLMPARFDLDRTKVMTSDEIVNLKRLPHSILIVGGGYIGCEYATIFARYGVQVTLVERLPTILATEDSDVVKEVTKSFIARGVTIIQNAGLDALQISGERVEATLSNGQTVKADVGLIAVGRTPNSQGLGLEQFGIMVNEHGAIEVDLSLRTSKPAVYAIGDVIDRELRLAHVSEKEGIIGISDILRDLGCSLMSYEVIPTAIFVHPEVASVGKREFQLKKEGADYVVGKTWYKKNAMAQCSGDTTGFVKLLVDRATLQLVGAAIAGSHASDLIGIIATAMNAHISIKTLAHSVWFHPSRPEAIKEAAEAALSKLAP
jgi:dihydrolipoamide dehydrogenase